MNYRIMLVLFVATFYAFAFAETITGLYPLGDPLLFGGTPTGMAWCTDCAYIAAGGRNGIFEGLINIYKLDTTPTETLSFTTSTTIGLRSLFSAVAWCNDCSYLAAGGQNKDGYGLVHVYHFDTAELSLLAEQTIAPGSTNPAILSVAWCGNCDYLAAGGKDADGNGLINIYKFDTTPTASLSLATTQIIPAGISDSYFNSVAWCDECTYLAAGGYIANNETPDSTRALIQIYDFDSSTSELSFITSQTMDAISKINSVAWCDGCNTLAVGGQNSDNEGFVRIYSFDTTNLSLTTSITLPATSQVNSVAWCDTCNYLAIGGTDLDNNNGFVKLYSFVTDTLSLVDSQTLSFFALENFNNLSWCNNCTYLTVDGIDADNIGYIQLLRTKTIIPPTVHAQKRSVRFPAQLDIINTLCWSAVTDAIAYNVYADANKTVLLAHITAEPYCYSQHQIIPSVSTTYYVTAINASGLESDTTAVII